MDNKKEIQKLKINNNISPSPKPLTPNIQEYCILNLCYAPINKASIVESYKYPNKKFKL